MPEQPYNPYTPPEYLPEEFKISLSVPVRKFGTALLIVIVVQTLSGVATATVVMNEGVSGHSFIVGMALFTMILCALLAYAGATRSQRLPARSLWAMTVTVAAWGVWLLSIWCTGYVATNQLPVSRADLFQFLLMSCFTFIFTMLFLNRTLPRKKTGFRDNPSHIRLST